MKLSVKFSSLLGAIAILASGCSTSERQSQSDDSAWNDKYRSNYEVVPGSGQYTGRSPFFRRGETEVEVVKAAPKTPEPRQPAPKAKGNCTEIRTGLTHGTITMPAQVTLGEEFSYDITVTALDCLSNLVVTDQIPKGATYVKSEAAATKEGDILTWKVASMDAGEKKTFKVWLRPDAAGVLKSCATIHADPRMCAETLVGKATLGITKTGPATAKIGDNVTYTVTVSNSGNTTAKNVVITDTIPEGLSSADGKTTQTITVGDLAPGQSKSHQVTLKATKRGKVCNQAAATSSNAAKVNAEACTTINQPGLKLAKTGPKDQFMGRNAEYTIVVSNTGDTQLNNVSVVDTAPVDTKIVSAQGATISGNTATWTIPTLNAGEEKTFKVSLTSLKAGTHCNKARASVGTLAENAEACTTWKGYPALLIEVVDDPDPLQVGESTTYTIRVTNQGTADDTNVGLTIRFPAQITPASPQGASAGTIDGSVVKFAPYARLEPKKSIEYKVKGKAVSLGDGRLKVELTSGLLKSPVTEEESTQVY